MTCAEGRLLLTKLDMSRSLPEIRYSIRVHADMTWKAFVYSMELTTSQLTAGVPVELSTTAAVRMPQNRHASSAETHTNHNSVYCIISNLSNYIIYRITYTVI